MNQDAHTFGIKSVTFVQNTRLKIFQHSTAMDGPKAESMP